MTAWMGIESRSGRGFERDGGGEDDSFVPSPSCFEPANGSRYTLERETLMGYLAWE